MGNYHLAGTEYVTSDPRETILGVALASLIGQQGILSLKTGQHTAIWRSACVIDAVIRREERIEEGHLTVEQVAFQLVPRTYSEEPGQKSNLNADAEVEWDRGVKRDAEKKPQRHLNWEVTLPVDQFVEVEVFPRETNLHFQGYTWSWRPR
ncbi:hypothetical protein HM1_2409 [Heliomicrobium modesticaldum Ice1]|uniref:Uncharacterized protein n=1 Tax=Heliobacterium modesticaldum (strain ATCC 51547 / Ice1) TaxID=498761 RepID=B0TIL8_HELMI|nr:hypothetical protein [Heliomicrobium modesticaldum]ABZ84959.1 hypothetical protein HM1_2409 [Heliomicrobium modesticaldum Ice1]